MTDTERDRSYDIAITGLSFRLPGADSTEKLWDNLSRGVRSITTFTPEELLAAGVDAGMISHPDYVPKRPVIADVETFDAGFFGLSPREAQIIDPQQRLFLQCAWHGLESAGHDPSRFPGRIGVFAGVSVNNYFLNHLLPNPELAATVGAFQTRISSDKDFVATRVSYKLDLRGPSLDVQTACSTSLVAVHLACQSLLNRECDMALAGGATVYLPQTSGYLYQNGGIDSPDGRCRPFDARAAGTLFGNGVGVVTLRRFEDAVVDRDPIHAVIRGSAINNDGAAKAGYTAPSIEGQTEVIAEALSMADLAPASLGYIETHGTATPIGDLIEITALKKAFEGHSGRATCALGSVKSNFGHLDSAAGVAGLIKAVLAVENGLIPPNPEFEDANPELQLEGSPFFVNSELCGWPTKGGLRRAGVSSFGIGGTNAHVVLEEAPPRPEAGESRPVQLLILSAKTADALEQSRRSLAAALERTPPFELPDIAHTLRHGRGAWDYRLAVVAEDPSQARRRMAGEAAGGGVVRQAEPARDTGVSFMFPGGGTQYSRMGWELYHREPVYRELIGRGLTFLRDALDLDLEPLLLAPPEATVEASRQLESPSLGLPALLLTELALAAQWRSWGVEPRALIGHSLGEYAAACVAEVLTLEEALRLVALRGRLFERLPAGSMLGVGLTEAAVRERFGAALDAGQLSLAAINGPDQCVLSGPAAAIDRVVAELDSAAIDSRLLRIDVAAHSAMVESILEEFRQHVRTLQPRAPRIPYISNVSGTWITDDEVQDAEYWCRHLRHTVRFSEGVGELVREPDCLLLEVGPGRTLTTFARRQCRRARHQMALPSMRHPRDDATDLEVLYEALGRLWAAGGRVDWSRFNAEEARRRVPLPGYPFARQRVWVDPPTAAALPGRVIASRDPAEWFYLPAFRHCPIPAAAAQAEPLPSWLVFADGRGVGAALARQLRARGCTVVEVQRGTGFRRLGDERYRLDPRRRGDFESLLGGLREADRTPEGIVHLWGLDLAIGEVAEHDTESGFLSLLFLAQVLGERNLPQAMSLWVVTDQLQVVTGEEEIVPAQALLLGPCRVIPLEYPDVRCRNLDLKWPKGSEAESATRDILREILADRDDSVVAWRHGRRWVESFEPLALEDGAERLRHRGVYLITGGFGSMGMAFARSLATRQQARLALVGRVALTASDAAIHGGDGQAGERLRQVRELQALGAEVLVLQADVTDRASVERAVKATRQRFGALHGVIHTAGMLGQGLIALKKAEDALAVLAPKVQGALHLDAACASDDLDLFLSCGSRSAVTPFAGQVDYCAANAFLDAFAHARSRRRSGLTLTLDWGFWQELGMAGKGDLPAAQRQALEHGVEALAVEGLDQAGVEIFERALRGAVTPQLVVSREPVDYHRELAARLAAPAAGASAQGASRPDDLETSYAAPSNDLERRIVALWEELLGIEELGVEDDFFELGGHSLLATRLVSRLRSDLQVEVPLRDFFAAATPGGLASLVAERLGAETGNGDADAPSANAVLQPIPRRPQELIEVPQSFAQQRLWYQHCMHPSSCGYNVSAVVRLTGNLDVTRLRHGFAAAVHRHEILRTVFDDDGGRPIQRILPRMAIPLPCIDLRSLPPDDRRKTARRLAATYLQVPFRLRSGPLLRLLLARVGRREHTLFLEMHHIITDAWSLAVLLLEVVQHYEAQATLGGPAQPLAALPIQYGDFALWQQQRDDMEFAEEVAYWRRRLEDLPAPELPTDHPRPKDQSYLGAAETRYLPQPLSDALRDLSRRREATLFATLASGFLSLLSFWSDREDLAVGFNIANRDRRELEDLIGFFLENLVLRADLSRDVPFVELVDQVRRSVLDAYAHGEVPFSKLVQALRPQRDLGGNPFYRVKIDFQNLPLPEGRFQDLELRFLDYEPRRVHSDLTLYVLDARDELALTLEYRTDLFEPATIQRLMAGLTGILTRVAEAPETRLADLRQAWKFAGETYRQQQAQSFKSEQRDRLNRIKRRARTPVLSEVASR